MRYFRDRNFGMTSICSQYDASLRSRSPRNGTKKVGFSSPLLSFLHDASDHHHYHQSIPLKRRPSFVIEWHWFRCAMWRGGETGGVHPIPFIRDTTTSFTTTIANYEFHSEMALYAFFGESQKWSPKTDVEEESNPTADPIHQNNRTNRFQSHV